MGWEPILCICISTMLNFHAYGHLHGNANVMCKQSFKKSLRIFILRSRLLKAGNLKTLGYHFQNIKSTEHFWLRSWNYKNELLDPLFEDKRSQSLVTCKRMRVGLGDADMVPLTSSDFFWFFLEYTVTLVKASTFSKVKRLRWKIYIKLKRKRSSSSRIHGYSSFLQTFSVLE